MTPLQVTLDPERPRIVLTREFDAPRELVFRVMTDPALVPRWWGPAKYRTTVEEMDVRPGGAWRYAQADDDGNAFTFSGVYREVEPPERLSYTFEFSLAPGHVSTETVVFEDLGGGRTRLVNTVAFDTMEERDAMASSGMESGAGESMDRLEALLGERRGA